MNTKLIITGLAFISLSVFVNAQENKTTQSNVPPRGARYVDANNDGICDNFNTGKTNFNNKGRKGNGNGVRNGQGQGRGMQQGQGRGMQQGPGRGMHQGQGRAAGFVETDPLTEKEIIVLRNLKEEEKLARDVYAKLYEKWGSNVFANIMKAERVHLKSVNHLLKYYGNADTLIAKPGEFSNPDYLTLYNKLVEKGSLSFKDAMLTGALIEEMDISDINKSLAEASNRNIVMVFENLARGSRNHLRAFNRQLSFMDVVYSPEYISDSNFQQIINSPLEKGNYNRKPGKGMSN